MVKEKPHLFSSLNLWNLRTRKTQKHIFNLRKYKCHKPILWMTLNVKLNVCDEGKFPFETPHVWASTEAPENSGPAVGKHSRAARRGARKQSVYKAVLPGSAELALLCEQGKNHHHHLLKWKTGSSKTHCWSHELTVDRALK